MISNLYSMKTVNNNLKKISIVLILLNSILVFYTAGLFAYELDKTYEPNYILPHMCSYLTLNNDIMVITDRNNEILIRQGSLCFTREFDSSGNAVDAFSSHISGHFTINAEDYEDITTRFQDDEEYREYATERINQYALDGYYVGTELILTHETKNRPLRTRIIDSTIEKYLL